MMNSYIPEEVMKEIEQLKASKKFDEAMRIVNSILVKDPHNEEALLQIADIQYQQGNIAKADKAVDFLAVKKKDDPLALYIKGILEMEKNHRENAKKYLSQAMKLTHGDNHEIIRCYGLCEYWYGNREKGLEYLKTAFSMNNRDAEVIYNLIQIYMMEKNYQAAEQMIQYFQDEHRDLIVVDKDISRYDRKISLLTKSIETSKRKK